MKVKDVYTVGKITKDSHIVVIDKSGNEYPILSVLDVKVLRINRFNNIFFVFIDKQKK